MAAIDLNGLSAGMRTTALQGSPQALHPPNLTNNGSFPTPQSRRGRSNTVSSTTTSEAATTAEQDPDGNDSHDDSTSMADSETAKDRRCRRIVKKKATTASIPAQVAGSDFPQLYRLLVQQHYQEQSSSACDEHDFLLRGKTGCRSQKDVLFDAQGDIRSEFKDLVPGQEGPPLSIDLTPLLQHLHQTSTLQPWVKRKPSDWPDALRRRLKELWSPGSLQKLLVVIKDPTMATRCIISAIWLSRTMLLLSTVFGRPITVESYLVGEPMGPSPPRPGEEHSEASSPRSSKVHSKRKVRKCKDKVTLSLITHVPLIEPQDGILEAPPVDDATLLICAIRNVHEADDDRLNSIFAGLPPNLERLDTQNPSLPLWNLEPYEDGHPWLHPYLARIIDEGQCQIDDNLALATRGDDSTEQWWMEHLQGVAWEYLLDRENREVEARKKLGEQNGHDDHREENSHDDEGDATEQEPLDE